jgi:hypothetical protein
MRLLLTAVMRLLLGSVGRSLATTFGAVNRQIRPAFERQGWWAMRLASRSGFIPKASRVSRRIGRR